MLYKKGLSVGHHEFRSVRQLGKPRRKPRNWTDPGCNDFAIATKGLGTCDNTQIGQRAVSGSHQ